MNDHDIKLFLIREVVPRLRAAQYGIDAMNFGSAREVIDEAIAKLPYDTGEGGIIWPTVEEK